MSKQSKQPRKDKHEATESKKEQVPRYQKPKGKKPETYAPNTFRVQARQELELAEKIASAKFCYSDIISGVHGNYLVGINSGNRIESHAFSVRTKTVLEKNGTPGYELKIIQGDVSAQDGGHGVELPFSWIFKKQKDCKFAPGVSGEIQKGMLAFLHEALRSEIEEEKLHRYEDHLAKQEADEIMQTLVGKPKGEAVIFKIATVDGKAVKLNQKVPSFKPLKDLVPGAFGRYNFAEKNFHCNVDYVTDEKNLTRFQIVSINQHHPLATSCGTSQGDYIYGTYLSKEVDLPLQAKTFLGEQGYAKLIAIREYFIKKIDEAHALSYKAA